MAEETAQPVKAERRLRPWVTRTLLAGGVLMLAGSVVAIIILRPEIAAQVGQRREQPVRVRINWPQSPSPDAGPGDTWLPMKIRRELLDLAISTLTGNPMDAAALARCESTLMETGWFSRITRVSRTPTGEIDITAEWRQPVAAVRSDGLDWIVSEKTELLPIHFPVGKSRMPLVLSPSSPRPEKPGQVWIGGDVEAGLALLGHLTRHEDLMKQVKGVDVSQFTSRRQLAIITERGNRIVWGTPTTIRVPGETSTQQKIAWMLEMLGDPKYNKRIDAGMPVVILSNPAGVMLDRNAINADGPDDPNSGTPEAVPPDPGIPDPGTSNPGTSNPGTPNPAPPDAGAPDAPPGATGSTGMLTSEPRPARAIAGPVSPPRGRVP